MPRKSDLKILDISLPLSAGLPVWPGDPAVVLERIRSISAGDASNDSRIACSVHSGTHVDAPAHLIENGSTVDQLALGTLIGPATVIEIPEVSIVTPEILEKASLPKGIHRLLIKTRNSTLWDDPHHPFHPEFAALSAEAAGWIVEKGIRLVGVDYLSIQLFRDTEPLTHRILLQAGIIIIEGLDLRNVYPGDYSLICLPVKLAGSDGAPARAVLLAE
jgi:arylformamidase